MNQFMIDIIFIITSFDSTASGLGTLLCFAESDKKNKTKNNLVYVTPGDENNEPGSFQP